MRFNVNFFFVTVHAVTAAFHIKQPSYALAFVKITDFCRSCHCLNNFPIGFQKPERRFSLPFKLKMRNTLILRLIYKCSRKIEDDLMKSILNIHRTRQPLVTVIVYKSELRYSLCLFADGYLFTLALTSPQKMFIHGSDYPFHFPVT